MEKQIMTMDATAANSIQESDAQLVSTLREIDPHNYAYLFERCKSCNVKARHLRFFKKDQIHELIPKSELGILAEFEYLLNQWQISKGYTSLYTQIQLNRYDEINNDKLNLIVAKEEPHTLCNNLSVAVAKQAIDIKPLTINLQGPQNSSAAMVVDEPDELLTVLHSHENSNPSNLKRLKFDEDDEEKFTLEIIIPELLNNLKNSYESKNSLSTNERRFLCSSIVDYFESRKIKFTLNTMDELAEQIVEHFPKEDKKSWFNRDGSNTRGRLFFRLSNSRRKMGKQTNNTSTSKAATNSTSSGDDEEQFTLETIIPELLKELKESYESNDFLSGRQRRLLCSSIVNYFVSRNIKFISDKMDEISAQIVEHFPTEDKKSWCNRDGRDTRGRLVYCLNNLRSRMAKQTSINFTSRENKDGQDKFTLETIIPELLQNLKESYESKDFLSTIERRLLCSSIVDYFVNSNIKFSLDTMEELAEQIVEHFPKEDKKSWCNRNDRRTCGRFFFRFHNSRRNIPKQTNNTSSSKIVTNSASSEDEDEDDKEQFTLETIIPELLNELKGSYETKYFLSRKERSLLCSSIVDYFESRKIKFSLDTMDVLAEQIAEHFPKEDKKSWCNRDGRSACGSFVYRLYNLRRNMAKQTNNTSPSKVVTSSASSEDENSQISNEKHMEFDDVEEQFTLEIIIPELLQELKDSYESKNTLSTNERRFLCSSIVDYFESRKVKLSFNTMDELAEQIVEHFPTEDKKSWYNRDGPFTYGRLYYRLRNLRRNMTKQTNNTSTSKVATDTTSSEDENSKISNAKHMEFDDDEEQFTLEIIIPELLKELKDSYESKNSLSTNERRFLSSAIVDYFVSRKIKFSLDTMDELAEQIVEHFPTEDKKFWCNRDGGSACGSFVYRLYKLHENMSKQTNNTSTSKVVTSSASSEDENSKTSNANDIEFDNDEKQFTLETIIPELLQNLKGSYESKNSLSTNERRFLSSAIVDYFESRKMKFSLDIMDNLAEQIVEHFPTEDKKSWFNGSSHDPRGSFVYRLYNSRRNMVKQTNNTPTSKVATNSASSEDEDVEEQFTLKIIIPEVLKELKDSYESKNSLSTTECRSLCSAIVDYFVSRKIKFSLNTMDELADQIVEHFPTEDKKSWFTRDGPKVRGRLIFRLRNSYKNRAKQTNTTSTSKVTLETIIPELLKELKDNYESKNSLSTTECRLLCSSIVDYFESRKIILSLDTMDELSEQIVEHFPTEDKKSWFNRDGRKTRGRLFIRRKNSRRNLPKQTYTTSTSKVVTNSTSSEDEDDEEQFTLEIIIPELLKELKGSYESKDFLSTNERRFLCSAIVDYFESRKIKFSLDTMDELAEQIVEHFPTEDKKYWCNRDGRNACGSFVYRLNKLRRNIARQTNNTSTAKVAMVSTSSEDENSKHMEFDDDEEQFTLEIIIPELLQQLKDSYESKNSLSRNERHLLCSSIVDYFENIKIKFSLNAMDVLAEQIVEHFPTEDKKSWYYRDGPNIRGRLYFRRGNSRRYVGKQTNSTSNSKVTTNSVSSEDENSKISNAKHMEFDDDEEQFTLEIIIPELFQQLKDSYESKNCLSRNERHLLCSSIVDYFVSRKIKFSLNAMDVLAEQIVEHFPTEDKKSWFNGKSHDPRGSFVYRLYNSRRNMAKQTNNTSTSKVVTNSASSEDEDVGEQFTLETIIPELLKELSDSYKSKNSLSTNERHFLCSSIVDYFVSRKIKFSLETMDNLAEQIVEHFPKEDKKSWCNRDGRSACGSFVYRLYKLRRNISKQTRNTPTSKVLKNAISSEGEYAEQFTLEKIIPELLKELKDSYKSKNSLSTNERRLLCGSVVDYFESRKIKFSLDTMDDLAEQIVEHFPTEDKKSWYYRDEHGKRGRLFFRRSNSRRNMRKQTNSASTSKVARNSASSEDENSKISNANHMEFDDDEEQFTLEIIIPVLLKELNDSYKSKNSLSTNERHFLCSAIVDYFESRKIKFSLDTMEELAEQIVAQFPTEDKKSWFNCDGRKTRGRLFIRLRNSRRNMDNQTNNTSSSLNESESNENNYDEDIKSIQAWLKSQTFENLSEIIDLWEDTMKYRCWQMQNLKDLKSILEFLNNWPSYKLETGHILLTMDFGYLYPQAMETFRTRWLVYKQNIEQFLKVELKDVNCIKLLEKYQLHKATTNEDSSSCILIYLVHAITKPIRHFEAVSGNVSYAITDSQHSMMRLIRHKVEIDEYTEPYPCIFVVGGSMLEVQECYVVFMDLRYKLSYENCLAVCVQIFTVMKVEDPPASQCFWEFIRGYMLNIAKDKEKFNLATENMVNYLETAASCV